MDVLLAGELRKQGYTLREFARLVEIDRSTFWRRIQTPRQMTLDEMERCCLLLRKSICSLVIIRPREDVSPCPTPLTPPTTTETS